MNRKSFREFFLLAFLMSTFFNSYSQIRTHVLLKKDSNQINIDGVINNREVEDSKVFDFSLFSEVEKKVTYDFKTIFFLARINFYLGEIQKTINYYNLIIEKNDATKFIFTNLNSSI